MPKDTGSHEATRFSQVLHGIACKDGRERITIGSLIEELGAKAHGSLILIFAILNVLPMPPGSSVFLAFPMVILTWRMAHGQSVWLPGQICSWSLPVSRVRALEAREAPYLERMERFIRPRQAELVGRRATRAIGCLLFLLSLITMIPLPLSAIAPAFSIVLIALGLLERDIAWISIGAVFGCASALLFVGVIAGLARAAALMIG